MKEKVCVIACSLVPETSEMTDRGVETVMRLYLKPEDVPLCEEIVKIKVLSRKKFMERFKDP